MSGTLSTPSSGQPNSTEDPKVATAVSALNAVLDGSNNLDGAKLGSATVPAAALASNSVTTAKITDANVTSAKLASGAALANLSAASVTDASLASPNNSAYRTLSSAEGATINVASGASNATTGTYYFGFSLVGLGTLTGPGLISTGASTNGTFHTPMGLFYFDSADYAVGSLTQKLRIRQQVIVGATSPSTVTLNCGLYPVTISSGNWTLGSVVSSSATSTTGLATNTISSFTSASGDFTIPSNGAYCLGVVVGSVTAPAGISISAQLQTRNT